MTVLVCVGELCADTALDVASSKQGKTLLTVAANTTALTACCFDCSCWSAGGSRKRKKPDQSSGSKASKKKKTKSSKSSKSSALTKSVKQIRKGRAAVDEECPIAHKVHVYEEGSDIYDCMLNQVSHILVRCCYRLHVGAGGWSWCSACDELD